MTFVAFFSDFLDLNKLFRVISRINFIISDFPVFSKIDMIIDNWLIIRIWRKNTGIFLLGDQKIDFGTGNEDIGQKRQVKVFDQCLDVLYQNLFSGAITLIF